MNKLLRTLISAPLCVMLGATSANAAAEPLRVCAAEDEMPYSNQSLNGFENDIARLIGEEMDREVEFVWSDRAAIFLVQDLLKPKKCDVIMGLDAGDPRVLTSEPYYRSSYVFIYRKDSGFSITNWDSPDLQKIDNFAITPGSPAETMLRQIGKYEPNLNYIFSLIGYKSRRNEYVRYEPSMLIDEVVQGNAGVAVIWGPEAGRYVQEADAELEMVPVPDQTIENGETVRFSYPQSLAVREGEEQLMQRLNKALAAVKPDIHQILRAEGIPLLDKGESVTATKTKNRFNKI